MYIPWWIIIVAVLILWQWAYTSGANDKEEELEEKIEELKFDASSLRDQLDELEE